MGFLKMFAMFLGLDVAMKGLGPVMDFVSGRSKLADLERSAQAVQQRNMEIAQRRLVGEERAGLLTQQAVESAMRPREMGVLQMMDPANYERVAAQRMPPGSPMEGAPGVRTPQLSGNPKLDAAMVGGTINPVLLDQLEASLG